MNAKQIGLSVLLADFLALTAYAVYQYGYIGFFELQDSQRRDHCRCSSTW